MQYLLKIYGGLEDNNTHGSVSTNIAEGYEKICKPRGLQIFFLFVWGKDFYDLEKYSSA